MAGVHRKGRSLEILVDRDVDRDVDRENNMVEDMVTRSRTINKKRRQKGNNGHFQMI